MDKQNDSRIKRLTAEICDKVENEVMGMGKDLVKLFIVDLKDGLIKVYNNWKKNLTEPCAALTIEQIQESIDSYNAIEQIAMEKKELAVMWAMERLGYSEEKMQEVLSLANEAYPSSKKRGDKNGVL